MAAIEPIHPALTVTHQSTVTEDQIDDLGHMNVRFYGRNATAASNAWCQSAAVDVGPITSMYTRHHHEQMLGAQLRVLSTPVMSDRGFSVYHELRNNEDQLAATFVHQFDQELPDVAKVALPAHGKPRSVRLDSAALALAPELKTLRELDLAVRLPRVVTTEDTLGNETVPISEANMLIWGGEPISGENEFVRVGPDGERVGMVVMESSCWVGSMPTAQTRIQSFGATMEIRDKVARSRSWCIDLETGQTVVVFESVNLACDLDKRRAMAVPPAERARLESRLHPEFDEL